MHKLADVNVLGTEYSIVECGRDEDKILENADGYCDHSLHKCVIDKLERKDNSLGDLDAYRRKVIRHELVHAFLAESGLSDECYWANSEEMVDWVAHQFPKLLEAFKQAGAI